jgi:hypothetical protein
MQPWLWTHQLSLICFGLRFKTGSILTLCTAVTIDFRTSEASKLYYIKSPNRFYTSHDTPLSVPPCVVFRPYEGNGYSSLYCVLLCVKAISISPSSEWSDILNPQH